MKRSKAFQVQLLGYNCRGLTTIETGRIKCLCALANSRLEAILLQAWSTKETHAVAANATSTQLTNVSTIVAGCVPSLIFSIFGPLPESGVALATSSSCTPLLAFRRTFPSPCDAQTTSPGRGKGNQRKTKPKQYEERTSTSEEGYAQMLAHTFSSNRGAPLIARRSCAIFLHDWFSIRTNPYYNIFSHGL